MRRADNIATTMCRLSRNFGSLNLLESSRPVQALMRLLFQAFFYRHIIRQSVELISYLFCSAGFKNPSPNILSWQNIQCSFTLIAEMQFSNCVSDTRVSAVLNIEFCSLLFVIIHCVQTRLAFHITRQAS